MSWPIVTLKEVTNLVTCGVAKRPDYVDDGVPFLSAKNVKNGEIVYRDYNYISQETHETLTKHNKPEIGDILYTRVGSVGEAAVIEKDICIRRCNHCLKTIFENRPGRMFTA